MFYLGVSNLALNDCTAYLFYSFSYNKKRQKKVYKVYKEGEKIIKNVFFKKKFPYSKTLC